MVFFIRQACALIGCFLSEASHYISKYRLHWPVACVLIAVISYNFGHYRGRADTQAADLKIQLEQKQANQTAIINTQETTLSLANKFTTARLPTAAETVMVKLPDGWEFSGQDRVSLIQEARRADRITEELKACKASLNSVYDAHEKYQHDMQEYEKKLKQ